MLDSPSWYDSMLDEDEEEEESSSKKRAAQDDDEYPDACRSLKFCDPSTDAQKDEKMSAETSHKRRRTAGRRPAVAKKVTADLDSDDELIVRMKNAKYREKDIAKRLADEGRIKYNSKTIGTRLIRIRKKQQERTDKLLDEGLVDWHDGDVRMLLIQHGSYDVDLPS